MRFSRILVLAVVCFLSYLQMGNAAEGNDSKPSSVPGIISDPVDSTITDEPAWNTTLHARDPNFSVSLKYGDKRLDRLLMLRNSVEALAELAQRNYHSHMGSFRASWPFEDVLISVDPVQPETDVPVRIAIRCIWWTIYFVTLERNFRDVAADCKWDNIIVAQVKFGEGEPFPSQTADNSRSQWASMNTTGTGARLGIPSLPMEKLLDEQINIDFGFFADSKALGVFDVFIVVMGTLSDVARWPSTEAVSSFGSGPFGPFDAQMNFDSARTIRARPPYYEYRHVIEALRRIPAWFMAQGKFKEIGIGIHVDEIWLASATLKRSYTSVDPDTPTLAGMPAATHGVAVA